MQIDSKKVLITGGGTRIGAYLAETFAAAGAQVICHYRNTLPDRRFGAIHADLSLPGGAEKLFAAAGRVDVLINNASMYRPGSLSAGAEACDREHFEVNFWSPLALMRAFAAQNIAGGAVVNLLDCEIFETATRCGGYGLSRRALADATVAMALEQAPRNLRFNGVAPGPTLPPPGLKGPGMTRILQQVPLGRKVELGDLAAAVMMLCCNDSITGEIICVDGGMHLN